MSDTPVTEYRFSGGEQRGSQFTLYPKRLLHDGGNVVEHIPLAHLASVRIAFEREWPKLKWAMILVVVAIILMLAANPIQAVAAAGGKEVADHVKRENMTGGVTGVLILSFRAIERGAALLPTLGWALIAWAAVLLFFYWRGRTTLTLTLAAVERDYSVGGRDRSLMAFADQLSARLAELSG